MRLNFWRKWRKFGVNPLLRVQKIKQFQGFAASLSTSVLVLTGNRGNVSNVKRVVGYSALYGENSIKEAFDVIEKKFAKDFEGCTLTELRYDEDVENRFAEEIEKYHKENNQ